MYNTTKINKIIEKAKKELQAILDKYEPELTEAIQAQLHKDDTLFCGMGTAVIERNGNNLEDNKFTDLLNELQNPIEGLFFNTPSKCTKLKVINK